MCKLTRIKAIIICPFLFALIIFLSAVCYADDREKGGSAVLSLRARPGWVDLYVVNQGPGDLDASYRISRSQLGSNVDFFFFTKKGACQSCRFSDEEDFLYSISLAERHGAIFPGEIVGASFLAEEIADRYSLKRGCYAFFAQFTRRNGQKFVSRSVSNVEKICIK
jgi:hypothetical protein